MPDLNKATQLQAKASFSSALQSFVQRGNGIFAKLGEDWFDEYWMNYGVTKMKKGRKTIPIKKLEDFVAFKGGDKDMIVPIRKKRKEKRT